MKLATFLFLCLFFFTGCSSVQYGTIPKSQFETDFYTAKLDPSCDGDGCGFLLTIENKTNKDLELDWNKTLYIRNGGTFGGFMLEGDNYVAKDLAKQNTIDIIFTDQTFRKIIWPKKLVTFDEDDKDWIHQELGEGEHGVFLSIKTGSENVNSKIFILGSSKKGAFSKLVDKTVEKTKSLMD
ncbi:MAG: hypothetical protein HQ517_02155 [SAR324 cluster bacterium]|nr:hypothetical protein [SAR324 cluster bacterium]